VLDVLEKTMTEPTLLRPMSPLQISVRSFGIYFRNFPVLLAFAAFLFGPPVALVALGQCLSLESSRGGLERVCNSVTYGLPEVLLLDQGYVAAILFTTLGMVGLYAAFFYYYAAATLAVSLHIIGLKASFIQILRRLRVALAIQLFGTGLLWGLAVLIGSLLLVIPGIILFVRYIFASPVVVLEHTAYSSALRRSRELGRGYWWRILFAYLIGQVVIFILYIGLSIALWILFNLLEVPDISVQTIFDVATTLVFTPVGCIYTVLIYYDLRIRKEALNLDTIRETI
jgi:hypothetical protein